MEPTRNTVDVPGATLYYEVRGRGPVLLLICGGIYDAAGFGALAGDLADRYSVITYDRRGNGRSPIDGPHAVQSVQEHADDAHRLLAAVTAEPAYVFGNSSGAQIGLVLAARHPEQVRTLVAHEPPLLDLLPDAARYHALIADVGRVFREQGAGPAMGVFGAGMGMRAEEQQGPPDPETIAMFGRMEKNMEFFIGYETPAFGTHVTDVEAIRASGVRVVLGAGDASAGEPPNRATQALAERLGARPVTFPGDHGGFGIRHAEFAATLDRALSDAA
jgi:pimeloyl-ACP methyl ester carboxylesterase